MLKFRVGKGDEVEQERKEKKEKPDVKEEKGRRSCLIPSHAAQPDPATHTSQMRRRQCLGPSLNRGTRDVVAGLALLACAH